MKSRAWHALLITLLIVGCTGSESTGPEVVNQAPTIVLLLNAIAIPRTVAVNISVAVSDPNPDDVLTTTWSITSGALSGTGLETRTWTPPSTVGSAMLTVTVSDGGLVRKIEEEIKVGTLLSAPFALTTYTKTSSPYIIRPNATPPRLIVAGTTTIEAGVEFFIDVPEMLLDVTGTLLCPGTVAERITIRPNDRTLRCAGGRGWWKGIRVSVDAPNIGMIDMDYTDVSYGENNIRIIGSAAVVDVNNSTLKCGNDSGIRVEGGTLLLSNSEVSNTAGSGITIESVTATPTVTVNNCLVMFNDRGFFMNLADVAGASNISICATRIESNFNNGFQLLNAVLPVIQNNTFAFNGSGGASVNMFLTNTYPGGAPIDTLDLTNNYWGSPAVTAATIAASIDNDAAGVVVQVDPWRVTDPAPPSRGEQ